MHLATIVAFEDELEKISSPVLKGLPGPQPGSTPSQGLKTAPSAATAKWKAAIKARQPGMTPGSAFAGKASLGIKDLIKAKAMAKPSLGSKVKSVGRSFLKKLF